MKDEPSEVGGIQFSAEFSFYILDHPVQLASAVVSKLVGFPQGYGVALDR